MKVLLLLIVLIPALLFGQNHVTTKPQDHDWIKLYNESTGYLLVGEGADGIDTSLAFSAKKWEGVATLYLYADTTAATSDATRSDSSLSVGVQFKNKKHGWGCIYNDLDTHLGVTNFTKLDTIDRAYINVATPKHLYMNIGGFSSTWMWSDSARFIFYIGTGDLLYLKPEIGGQ